MCVERRTTLEPRLGRLAADGNGMECRGQRSALMQLVVPVAGTEADARALLTAGLALTEMRVGQRSTATAGASALSGIVEYVSTEPCDALLRLDAPGPGVAALGAFNVGGQSMPALSLFH